ncbi:2,3-dihydro-2,3-dihydroxybenzoate dehydrogenase [Ephemeroptericola cinctiostellae]|uniref:2,3-dihydro-2,3-dihydroxybenzoate dehydrogenase n=1 Tax=Ephemeroptericola cinctiostellae TaxID=2268024 RepID=A0A345DB67_9BURK|nr:2,3-dihydro-2,3-dihydroxybenzoate dehydrogenase [Ephemeroptericola cinctiostellae]AXF85605.1 2,3-dihydro-2,3-dihydroxybenzoate dehydrogenase [Ephemeroptericola cinctiostellae]
MDFSNQIAVVTGAAQGIGAAVVQRLLNDGAQVVLLDKTINPEDYVNVPQTHVFKVDVTNRMQVQEVIDAIEKEIGEVTMLVNVAGVLSLNRILDATEEEWECAFSVNVKGVFNVCQAIAQYMSTRRKGSIVTVASNASDTPRIGMGVYAASKAASTHLTHCLGLELAALGIRCNVVSPGSTDTPMQHQLWLTPEHKNAVLQGSLKQHRLGIPLGRIADADDVANAVCFLLSDQARHITMHDLRVDGGATV